MWNVDKQYTSEIDGNHLKDILKVTTVSVLAKNKPNNLVSVTHKVSDHQLHHECCLAAITSHWLHQLLTVGKYNKYIIISSKLRANKCVGRLLISLTKARQTPTRIKVMQPYLWWHIRIVDARLGHLHYQNSHSKLQGYSIHLHQS
jgi:hypothetical protein